MTVLAMTSAFASVLIGAALQRATGFGFAIVAVPILALTIGAGNAVSLVAVLGSALSILIVCQMLPSIDWRAAAFLIPAALVAVPLGQVIAGVLAEPALLIVVGLLTVAAVGTTAGSSWQLQETRLALLVTGAVAGLMNVTAGLGGPALAVYTASRRWAPTRTVATAQVLLLVMGVATVLAKGLPAIDGQTWAMTGSAIVLGTLAGNVAAKRTPQRIARGSLVVLGCAAGAIAVMRGLFGLMSM